MLAKPVKDNLVAVYYIETKKALADVARELVELETTGRWQGRGKPTALFESCRGTVAEVKEKVPGKGVVMLLYPLKNLNLEESAFASIWLYLIGGATHALTAYDKSRLLDFALPDDVIREHFPGPGFGLTGTRKLLNSPDDEPIIGTIVKPTAGLTAKEVADICYEFAAGGLRFIKDDEKMLNTSYCPLAERVKLVTEALRRAEDKTSLNTLYAPHITTGPQNLLRYASTAIKNGATALMVNIFAAGFYALEMLRKEFGVPIYAHCGGKEAFGRAEGQGVSPEVVAKFARLMGGDYFRSNIIGGYLVGGSADDIHALVDTMRMPLGGLREMAPAFSGGLNPSNLMENLKEFGTEIMVLAGTGITGYPGGIAKGVEAMKEVVRAFLAEEKARAG